MYIDLDDNSPYTDSILDIFEKPLTPTLLAVVDTPIPL